MSTAEVIDADLDAAHEPLAPVASVYEALTDEEIALAKILMDRSGVDLCEFALRNADSRGGRWRAWPFQVPWYRREDPRQISACGRSTGKSEGIQARALAFPFNFPGAEMAIVAPEGIHVNLICDRIEHALTSHRLFAEMLVPGRSGITHRPFQAKMRNGTRIVSRLPKHDGSGVKGLHCVQLVVDEGQDMPERAWEEMRDTVNRHIDGSAWRVYGVTLGVPNTFHVLSQPDSGWTTNWYTQLHKPTWTDEEREHKTEEFKGTDSVGWQRNVLGLPGSGLQNSIFSLSRLMRCWSPDTPVHTSEGPKRIDQIEVGDLVQHALGEGRVKRVIRSCHTCVVRITTDDGSRLVCSPEHRLWTRRGWVRADQLRTDDVLVRRAEAVRTLRRGDYKSAREALLWESMRREGGGAARSQSGSEADAVVRVVWSRVLPSEQGDSLLWQQVRGPVAWNTTADRASAKGVRVVQGDVRPAAGENALLHDELSSAMGERKVPEEELQGSACEPCRSGWSAEAPVHPLAGTRRSGSRVVRPVLALSARCDPGPDLVDGGHRGSCPQDRNRSRWAQPQVPAGGGRQARCVASIGRVARVEVLERGSPEFTAICGGSDSLVMYDLTVEGHPSYSVGDHGFLVHNCVDTDESSDYNLVEFVRQEIRTDYIEEHLRRASVPSDRWDEAYEEAIRDAVVLSELHRQKYEVFWIGMDVGIAKDPSAIMVLAEYHPKGDERTRDRRAELAIPPEGKSRLKLVARIELLRVPVEKQAAVVLRLIEHYKPRGFAMDSTGNGLGILQVIQAAARKNRLMQVVENTEAGDVDLPTLATAQTALTVIRGYQFMGKILVAIDETVAEELGPLPPEELIAKAGVKRQVKEWATDVCREYVDGQRFLMPYDPNLVNQMTGQTWEYSNSPTDAYGNRARKFSEGAFHAFDGLRMAALAHYMHPIEQTLAEMLKPKKNEDVFVRFASF